MALLSGVISGRRWWLGLRPERTQDLGIGFKARPINQIDTIRHGSEHRIETSLDGGGLAGQVDNQAGATSAGDLA